MLRNQQLPQIPAGHCPAGRSEPSAFTFSPLRALSGTRFEAAPLTVDLRVAVGGGLGTAARQAETDAARTRGDASSTWVTCGTCPTWERNGPEGPPRPVSVPQSPRRPERVAVFLDYDTKYVGFGSLYVRSAWPPSRSEYWSPKLATMSYPRSVSMCLRVPDLYCTVVQVQLPAVAQPLR
ncbi:hypothetical protein SAMN05216533_6577 [Streptomyces sp. Ag109_O5-10]|nr:hypothetical protein SAMN05216533_6577 [Streptomyces sp. Ag109_O5-10]